MINELRADPGSGPADRDLGVTKRRSRWPTIVVLVVAAAFIGVIWVAYRDGGDSAGSGNPPLVKAEPGPTKIKPDQPGGQDIPFQNSTVYDRLGQNGQKPQAEKLLPPPETPVARAPQPVEPPAAAVPPVTAPPAASVPPAVSPPVALAPPPQPTAAPVAPPAPHISDAEFAALQKGGPASSPTALAPKSPASAPPTFSAPAAVAPAVPKAAVTTKPAAAGGVHIQLGSVKSAADATAEWDRLKGRFPETLSALKMSPDKVEVPDKGTFYRIQAGPLDEAKAKSVCDHLKAQGAGCIVVKS